MNENEFQLELSGLILKGLSGSGHYEVKQALTSKLIQLELTYMKDMFKYNYADKDCRKRAYNRMAKDFDYNLKASLDAIKDVSVIVNNPSYISCVKSSEPMDVTKVKPENVSETN